MTFVLKFGGTSVEDAAALRRVAEIIGRHRSHRCLVVASACSGVTNTLLRIGALASSGSLDEARSLVDTLERRHRSIATELFPAVRLASVDAAVCELTTDLRTFVSGLGIVGEASPRSLDLLASYGERLSTTLLNAYLQESGLPSALVDARTLLITDRQFTHALPQIPESRERLRRQVLPLLEAGTIVVTQGFVGGTEDGSTTTIGRGGSDYSAALFGAMLDADEIQIWTDVDGILTADPTVVDGARRIRLMSFGEASELAYFGARVLHPETIRPAVERDIPVRVLNSRRPAIDGTLILSAHRTPAACRVKSVAYKEQVTLINIVSTKMFLSHGFLEEVFDIFHRFRTVVHTVATSDVSISVTINDTAHLTEIVQALEGFANVTVTPHKAIVCVVGDNLRASMGITAKIFAALQEEKVNMISQGASEINLSFVVDEERIEPVVRRLHAELFQDVERFPEIFA